MSSPIDQLKFCVIDLETTGSFPNKDRIIDIGLVHVDGFEIGETKNFLVNPKMKIPHFVQKLTKIKQKDVQHSPTIDQVIDQVIHFIGDRILIAHNISFDIPFLNGVLKRLNKNLLENKSLCTNVMSKNLLPEMISSNLAYLNKTFDLPKHKAHRALADAIMTADLLVFYLRFFEKRGISKVNQLYYPAHKFEFHKCSYTKDQIKEVSQTLDNLPMDAVVTFTGDEAKILSTYPVGPQLSKLKKIIIHKLDELEWNKVTIQLTSHLYESLQIIKTYIYKISKNERTEILSLLSKELIKEQVETKPYDFVLSSHIIEGQFALYTQKTNQLSQKLLFKFPKHQRKFLNQVKKLCQNFKKRKAVKKTEIDLIINQILFSHPEEYFVFTYIEAQNLEHRLWNNVEKIVTDQENHIVTPSFPKYSL